MSKTEAHINLTVCISAEGARPRPAKKIIPALTLVKPHPSRAVLVPRIRAPRALSTARRMGSIKVVVVGGTRFLHSGDIADAAPADSGTGKSCLLLALRADAFRLDGTFPFPTPLRCSTELDADVPRIPTVCNNYGCASFSLFLFAANYLRRFRRSHDYRWSACECWSANHDQVTRPSSHLADTDFWDTAGGHLSDDTRPRVCALSLRILLPTLNSELRQRGRLCHRVLCRRSRLPPQRAAALAARDPKRLSSRGSHLSGHQGRPSS